MDRNHRCRAIVLRTYPIGDIHKGTVLLTDAYGVVHAIAHGAASSKGKLRAVAELFVEGEASLYHNPVKQSTKLTELDVSTMHYGVRENLLRYYAASLWLELVAASYAGGEETAGEVYSLLSEALAVLDPLEERRVLELSIYLLWRYLALSGLAPQLGHCGECGRELSREARAYWAVGGGELRCEYCRAGATGGAHSALVIEPPTRAHLRRVAAPGCGAVETLQARLQPDQACSLHAVLVTALEQAFERRFKTLESGAAVLYARR